jgi:general secretion pathway protein D
LPQLKKYSIALAPAASLIRVGKEQHQSEDRTRISLDFARERMVENASRETGSKIQTTETGFPRKRNRRKAFTLSTIAAGLAILCGCQPTQSLGPIAPQSQTTPQPPTPLTPPRSAGTRAPEVANAPAIVPTERAQIISGNGELVRPPPPPSTAAQATAGQQGDITLNFVDADVHEVLPRVLGDILHLTYTIDPKIQATITVQTSRPLKQDDVLPVLQEVLRASGLTLVQSDGIYRLVAGDDAQRTGAVPVTVGSGPTTAAASSAYNVQVLPLKYASATELQQTLSPFVPKGAVIQADPTRNVLILSGTGVDLSTVTDMIKAFDVDWISGMSFGIIPLQTASPKSVSDQLTNIFGPKGSVPLPGMLSFAPLDRMNAILVVSPQRAYVEQARMWIERLDRGETETQPRIFEYHVQNSRAADIAKVLTGLFSNSQVSTIQAQTAPGTTATQIGGNYGSPTLDNSSLGSSPLNSGGPGLSSGSQTSGLGTTPGGASGSGLGQGTSALPQGGSTSTDQNDAGSAENGPQGSGFSNGLQLPPVRIIADEKNNNLVIYARPRDYRMIQDALAKIDVVPLQVLIEATIAEVTLSNDLQYGLQYFFHQHENQFSFGNTATPIMAGTAIAGVFPGFNYVLGSANANVVLNLLSSITDVHVVSAPELLVLDHQSASLLVGNEIPIPTAQIQSTVTSGAPIVNTVQYVDTGVILKVSPRVNASGLVTLDISQEVSSVPNSTSEATASLGPTITQRRIQSTITVQDGETVALGGLIQDTHNLTRNGLPLLSDVPVIGPLFRSTDRSVARTELLVLLEPKVLHNAADARAATDELRSRLHSLQDDQGQTP